MSSHTSELASLSEGRSVISTTPAPAQPRREALRAAWIAHTVNRSLAAVASASDADYGAFGWERAELIARLQWLRDEIERPFADCRVLAVVTLASTAHTSRSAT
jgi:hypothetical protein